MKARLLCSSCGKFVRWGDTSDGKPSRALCPECFKIEMENANMKTEVICCVCGKHLRWIDTPHGGTSHDYCPKHFEEAMREVDDAFRRDEALRAIQAKGDDNG